MHSKEKLPGTLFRGVEYYPSSQVLRAQFEKSPYQEAILDYFSTHNVSIEELFRWPQERRGLLSDIGILRHFLAGNIEVDPFNIKRLQNNGYDVSLGEFYYVSSVPKGRRGSLYLPAWSEETGLYDPLDPDIVALVWGDYQLAETVAFRWRRVEQSLKSVPKKEWEGFRFLRNYEDEDRIIVLEPNEMILGHTKEFIGGKNVVSTTISGKSSVGRNFTVVCSDANLGDVGFRSRWALELENKTPSTGKAMAIVLLVGQPIATIQFIEVEPPVSSYQGVYQSGQTLEEIKAGWKPEDLLPKMRKNL